MYHEKIELVKRSNAPFSILMLDLNHFKLFNDTHGHEAGDAVLKGVGRFLQQHVRGSLTLSEGIATFPNHG